MSYVFQAVFSGVNAGSSPTNVSLPSSVKSGDILTSAIVIVSTNGSYPVATDVTSAFYNPVSSQGANLALLMNGANYSNTTILATFSRG